MARWSDVMSFAKTLPGVEEATSYGEPSLKVRRALLTRLRRADESIVLMNVVPDERVDLIAAEPEAFFLEPHYEPYPIVLVRLAPIPAARLSPYLWRRWRGIGNVFRQHRGARAGCAAGAWQLAR